MLWAYNDSDTHRLCDAGVADGFAGVGGVRVLIELAVSTVAADRWWVGVGYVVHNTCLAHGCNDGQLVSGYR